MSLWLASHCRAEHWISTTESSIRCTTFSANKTLTIDWILIIPDLISTYLLRVESPLQIFRIVHAAFISWRMFRTVRLAMSPRTIFWKRKWEWDNEFLQKFDQLRYVPGFALNGVVLCISFEILNGEMRRSFKSPPRSCNTSLSVFVSKYCDCQAKIVLWWVPQVG